MDLTEHRILAESLLEFHQSLYNVKVSGEDYKTYLRTHPIEYVPATPIVDAYRAFFRGCRMDTYKCFQDTYIDRWDKIAYCLRSIAAEIAENA